MHLRGCYSTLRWRVGPIVTSCIDNCASVKVRAGKSKDELQNFKTFVLPSKVRGWRSSVDAMRTSIFRGHGGSIFEPFTRPTLMRKV